MFFNWRWKRTTHLRLGCVIFRFAETHDLDLTPSDNRNHYQSPIMSVLYAAGSWIRCVTQSIVTYWISAEYVHLDAHQPFPADSENTKTAHDANLKQAYVDIAKSDPGDHRQWNMLLPWKLPEAVPFHPSHCQGDIKYTGRNLQNRRCSHSQRRYSGRSDSKHFSWPPSSYLLRAIPDYGLWSVSAGSPRWVSARSFKP